MKKKLWAVLVAFVALTVFATSAFAVVRWRNVASIYPGISAGDNSYTCEISCLSGTTKIDCTLVLYEKGLFGTYSEVSRSSSTYYGHTHDFHFKRLLATRSCQAIQKSSGQYQG